MTLSINSKQPALLAHRHPSGTLSTLTTAMKRLSSGARIDSSKDDAAGPAISARYAAQFHHNDQAARNANDGISLLHTVEAALATTAGKLHRIRELAVRATDSTDPTDDQKDPQAEIRQLAGEIERISSTTKFDGRSLFDQGRESAVGESRQFAIVDGRKPAVGWMENGERLIRELFGPAAAEATRGRIDGANERVTASGAANGDHRGFDIGAIGRERALDVIGSPSQLIEAMDRVLAHVESERARVGARMSRYESTIGSLQRGTESPTEGSSRIHDADFASETTAASRAQILHGVGNAMVAQANQRPSAVLDLLLR